MCVCVIQRSESQLRHQPVLLASFGPRFQSVPPQHSGRSRDQPLSAEHDSQDSDESEDETRSYSNQIAMQIFSSLVGNMGLLRRRCVCERGEGLGLFLC